MLYQRKPMTVDAIKLLRPMEVAGKHGKPGDYLVTFEDGSITIVTGPIFEGNFQAVSAYNPPTPIAQPIQAPQPIPVQQSDEPKPTGLICLGCGSEVQRNVFDPATGMCAECLKKTVVCQNCQSTVQQFEIVGTYCRRCLKPA